MLVLAVMGCDHAYAQCVPSTSQPGQAITCSGTQAGGYTIATDQTPLTVTAGSSIQNSGDALTVAIPANYYYYAFCRYQWHGHQHRCAPRL